MNLNFYINKSNSRVRERFDAMNEDQQQIIRQAFARHLRACAKSNVTVDPMFLEEAVGEITHGRGIVDISA